MTTTTVRYVSTGLVLACFFSSMLAGSAQSSKGSGAAAGGEGPLSVLSSRASEIANILCEKASEYAASPDSLLPMIGMGAAAATLVACTLYGLSRYFDSDPFLFNGGKLGKLEAQSAHNASKKCS